MKTRNSKTKAFAFLGAAFVLLIALIFTGCPHKPESGGGTGGGNQTSSITVRFDETTIKVAAKGDDGGFHYISTGTAVSEGKSLRFFSKNLPSGKQVDKWKVNTKELDSDSYTVNAADAVDNGSNKVITVTYTAQTGVNPVFVVFDSRLVGVYDPLSGFLESGNLYEGTNLEVFTPDTGEEYLTFVNAKKLTGSSYTVNAADAIDEGGQKVIRIRLTVPNPKTLTVQFNSADIECKTFDGTAITPISPGYKGPAYTYVMLKAKTPMGKSVKHWEINGNIINASEGAEWLEGQADPAVATPDGTITISVIFE